ncbi:MAG TPA: DNA ligase [Polyangium sp.]|nr:DNA ligase [Polyangium sp.]
MPDLADGESTEVQGSGSSRYQLRNIGGVYSCSCPAWRNQSLRIEKRTCKHLKAFRGEAVELARIAGAAPPPATTSASRSASPATSATSPATASSGDAKQPPPLLLAHSWDNVQDLTGYWMSEKLDGIRAYWNGNTFISRLGNEFYAPDWFLEGFPDMILDGELWAGRKKFQRATSIVRRQDRSDHWKEIVYVVFDAPNVSGSFEDRMAEVKKHLSPDCTPYARVLEQERCQGIDHLRAELERVEKLGGEGLMMRRPGSKYEIGRSFSLLKVKTFHDAEARIVAHQAGTGKHKGRLGSLLVELPNGIQFSVGTGLSDKERESPPPIGATITFRYQELSDTGVPRFPSYVGERHEGVHGPAAPPRVVAAAAPAPRVTPVAPVAPIAPIAPVAPAPESPSGAPKPRKVWHL